MRAEPFSADKDKLVTIEWIEGKTDRLDIGKGIVKETFTRSTGGWHRFNDDKRGAWYCAFSRITAAREVAYHLKRLQDETDEPSKVRLQGIFADFIGIFRCAKRLPRGEGILRANLEIYPETQKFANKLRNEGARGIIYPSVRDRKGVCLAAFLPEIVQNARYEDCWKMSWNEEGEPSIEKI